MYAFPPSEQSLCDVITIHHQHLNFRLTGNKRSPTVKKSMDDWTRAIFKSFVDVLRRPRSGLQVGPVREINPGPIDSPVGRIRQLHSLVTAVKTNDETFAVFCRLSEQGAHVTCMSGNFRFSVVFSRTKPVKVRQTALKFVKKLNHKTIYDVMKS